MRGRTRIVEPFLELEGRYSKPESDAQSIDEQDRPEYPSGKMAARGDEQARAKDGKPSHFLDAAHQFHIFEERPVGTAPDLFKDLSANEDSLVPGGCARGPVTKLD